jgi:hypothetical protein
MSTVFGGEGGSNPVRWPRSGLPATRCSSFAPVTSLRSYRACRLSCSRSGHRERKRVDMLAPLVKPGVSRRAERSVVELCADA